MKTTPKIKQLTLACFLAAAAVTINSAGAAESEFQTKEYFSSNGLDLINAASAYDQGYTGKGVLIGLLDTPMREDHPELSGKFEVIAALDKDGHLVANPTTWTQDVSHGTHVASIMAAKKDDIGMHGVAFDSNVVGQVYIGLQSYYFADDKKFFQAHPEIKILNNSWNGMAVDKSFVPNGEVYSVQEAKKLAMTEGVKPHSGQLVKWAIENPNSLAVVAAANDGWVSPSFMGMLPRYYGSELGNWVTVVSLNPLDATRKDGKISLGPTGLSLFSNIARGAELFTVSAPGGYISAADAVTNGYTIKSGTSMATPQVSGAAALVAQAFPWMNGKQLADVILTTANSNIECPDILVGFDESTETALVFYYFYTEKPSEEQVIKALTETYNKDPEAWGYRSLNSMIEYFVKDHFEKSEAEQEQDKYVRLIRVTKEEVFGQGVLDAGKAVGGPARLDVNRMSSNSVKTYAEFGNTAYAFEVFDTQGHMAVFSNDISERLWDDKYHHEEYRTGLQGISRQTRSSENSILADKKPGLIKTGWGMLALMGTNTYSAPTIVEGGSLMINPRPDGSGGILVNSSVLVQKDGGLLGTGTVINRVINNGVFLPGTDEAPFTVGDYEQGPTGDLLFIVDRYGAHNQLKILNTAKVEGTLSLGLEKAFYTNEFSQRLQLTDLISLADGGQKPELNFSVVRLINDSPTLDFVLENKGENFVLSSLRRGDSYSRYAQTPAQYSLGQALYRIASGSVSDDGLTDLIGELDFSDFAGNKVQSALKNVLPNIYLDAQKAELDQSRLLNRFVSSGLPQNGVWMKSLASFADRSGTDQINGYNTRQAGAVGGLRTKISEQLETGLFFGVSDLNLKEDGTGSHYDSTLFAFGAEGRYTSSTVPGFSAFGSVFVGLSDSKITRKSLDEWHKAHWTGFTFGTQLGAELRLLSQKGISAGPFASIDYVFSHRPKVSESGGSIPQTLSKSSRGEVSTLLGLKIEMKQDLQPGILTAGGKIGWRHFYGSKNINVRSRFNASEESFYAQSDSYGRDALEGAVGFSCETKSGIYAGFEAVASVARKERSLGANFKIGKRF